MKASRKLDILAILGFILSIIIIAAGLIIYKIENAPTSLNDIWSLRSKISERISNPELRADFDISSFSIDIFAPHNQNYMEKDLDSKLKKFSYSPRINLRAGMLLKGEKSAKALKKAADLDKTNALPLYLLAKEAASNNSISKAIQLVREGNKRSQSTMYPLPYIDLGSNISLNSEYFAITPSFRFPINAKLRELARNLNEYAQDLPKEEKTAESLRILGDTKKMGWTLMEDKSGDIIDLFLGSAIVKISHKTEEALYKKSGDKSGLAQVELEKQKLQYLHAGVDSYLGNIMTVITRHTQQFIAPTVIIISLGMQIWFAIILFIISSRFSLKSKARAALDTHFEITENRFSITELLKLYALFFLPIGLICSVIFYYINLYNEILELSIVAFAVIVPSILLHLRAKYLYTKAYKRINTTVNFKSWKCAPIEEKRELSRRMAGVHGGAVVFLVLSGLLISGGMKLSTGNFPWQFSNIYYEQMKYERQYTKDLLAGKIIIPKKQSAKLINKNIQTKLFFRL